MVDQTYPYKDKWGLWRGPFETGKPKPNRCTKCKCKDLDCERSSDDDEYDERGDEYPDILDPLGSEDPAWNSLFSYMPDYAVCEECENWMSYGSHYYYNPDTNTYDLPRPLSRVDAERAEIALEVRRQLEAGQLTLFENNER